MRAASRITRSLVLSEMVPFPLSAKDTVDNETPRFAATSWIRGRGRPAPLRSISIGGFLGMRGL